MSDNILNVRIQEKYDTESNWSSKNPLLLKGEIAISSDKNNNYKVGNGVDNWNSLSYVLSAIDNNPTLLWGTKSKVASVGASDIHVTMPANPNTDRYVNSASFADDSTNTAASPVKMTLTRAGSDSVSVTANIPKVTSSSAGVAPKGAAVNSQSQSTKFLREDGTWAAPSYTTNTTYTFENGTNCFYVTPSGGTKQTVTVTPSITNNITGSGTSGYIAKFNGTNTITNGPAFGTSTTTWLNNKGEWTTPPNDNTTYTIATGDANGQIKVTPSSGSAYNVSVKGLGSNAYTSTAYVAKAGDTMSGALTFTTTNGIAYTGTKATYSMIRFKDNTNDNYGNGIIVGGGGLTVIGGGESADTVAAQHSSGGDEELDLASDGAVYVYTNVQSGWDSRKTFTFGTDGALTATKFVGALQGNADTATKATQDESGNNIKATYMSSLSVASNVATFKNKNGTSLGTITASTASYGSASAGTAISADDITAWDAGSTPTLGTAISADDITSWSAGTMFSASFDGKCTLTLTSGSVPTLSYTGRTIPNVTSVGSVPTLSYTARSIPNISVSSKTVVTGIS